MFKNFSPEALGVSGRQSEMIELALSFGFAGLDLDLAEFVEQTKTHGVPHARRLLDSSRLKIGQFDLPVNWRGEETEYRADLARLPELAEFAQQLGCTRTTTTIEAASDERPYHQNFEFHRRRFFEVAQALAPYTIQLGIGFEAPQSLRENKGFQFIQTADAAILLIRSVGADNVGLHLDLWHWHVGGGTVEQWASFAADKIVAVTLSDASPQTTAENADEAERLLPGAVGTIDAASALKKLSELRYDGPVTPKVGRDQLAGLGREKIAQAAGATLTELWKAAGLASTGRRAMAASRP